MKEYSDIIIKVTEPIDFFMAHSLELEPQKINRLLRSSQSFTIRGVTVEPSDIMDESLELQLFVEDRYINKIYDDLEKEVCGELSEDFDLSIIKYNIERKRRIKEALPSAIGHVERHNSKLKSTCSLPYSLWENVLRLSNYNLELFITLLLRKKPRSKLWLIHSINVSTNKPE